MNLAGVNHRETGGRRAMIGAAISHLAVARFDQTKLKLIVPVPGNRNGHALALAQLDLAKIGQAPDVDVAFGVH